MRESEDFSKSESNRELVSVLEPRALLPLERLFADLALITDEMRLVLNRADDYVLALEKLLAGKLTPTKDVAEVKGRLGEAKSKLAEIKEDFCEIEDFLSSTTKEYLSEGRERSNCTTRG